MWPFVPAQGRLLNAGTRGAWDEFFGNTFGLFHSFRRALHTFISVLGISSTGAVLEEGLQLASSLLAAAIGKPHLLTFVSPKDL